MASCTGTPVVEADPVQAPAAPTKPELVLSEAPPPAEAGVAWRSAWPVGEDRVAFDATQPGRLLGNTGTTEVTALAPCGDLHVATGRGVLWLPAGEGVDEPPAPVVSAALVERAAWRLADVLGPGPGIAPGVDAPDPALHRGIRVRSIRKVRRQGPPWQLVVGERRDQIVVALTDKDADGVMAGVVIQRQREGLVELSSFPAIDLDGDGSIEVVVAGDGAQGGVRAVLQADLATGALVLRSFEERAPVVCPVP
jgi:hypothetical protein